MERYFCTDCELELTAIECCECRDCGKVLCHKCASERDCYCGDCFLKDEENIIKEYLAK